MSKKKELGQMIDIDINITKPMKMEHNMGLRELTLMTGMNGAGKSLINKLVWLSAMFTNGVLVAREQKLPGDQIHLAQYLFDGTFTDNDFTGTIIPAYQFGNHVSFELEEGKVLKADFKIEDEVESSGMPVYMSTVTRLLTSFVTYIKTKNLLGLSSGPPTIESDMQKLLTMYRLYDILFIEGQLNKFSKASKEDFERFNLDMQKFDEDFEITSISIDYTKPDILYSNSKVTDKSILSFSSGEQSLINMIFANN